MNANACRRGFWPVVVAASATAFLVGPIHAAGVSAGVFSGEVTAPRRHYTAGDPIRADDVNEDLDDLHSRIGGFEDKARDYWRRTDAHDNRIDDHEKRIGDLTGLQTSDKTSLVAAVNETVTASLGPLSGTRVVPGTLSGTALVDGSVPSGKVDLVTSGAALRLENAAAPPAAPSAGRVFFNTTTSQAQVSNGSQWLTLAVQGPTNGLATTSTTETSGVISPGSTFTSSLRSVTYAKQADATLLKITYCDTVLVNGAGSYPAANLSLRVDGVAIATHQLGLNCFPTTVFTVAQSVPAGSHVIDVSLLATSSQAINVSLLGAPATILVEEVNP